MRLKRRYEEEPEINLTPLIDVVFLLLIFFMITTTFEKQTQMSVSFPRDSSQAKTIKKDKNIIEIVIDEKGSYYVNGQQLVKSDRAALVRALRLAVYGRRNLANLPVVISANAKAKHQHIINAMFASRQIGLQNVMFSTVKTK